jgi:hypothetical protein
MAAGNAIRQSIAQDTGKALSRYAHVGHGVLFESRPRHLDLPHAARDSRFAVILHIVLNGRTAGQYDQYRRQNSA